MIKEERFTLEVLPDEDAPNPYDDYDHLMKIVHWHQRGFFGISIRGKQREWLKENERDDMLILPLFLYEHSGQRISLSSFGDHWDSGQVGYCYCSKDDLEEFDGSHRYWRKRALQIIKEEVKELDDFLCGNVWGYVIKDRDGEIRESCWGFIGDEKECREEGMKVLSSLQESQLVFEF
jgi:hypothetical protein